MKIEDARKMKKGSAVQWSLGNGWYQKGEFLGLHMVTRFKSMTFNDLFTGNFDFSKGGKQELMASPSQVRPATPPTLSKQLRLSQ